MSNKKTRPAALKASRPTVAKKPVAKPKARHYPGRDARQEAFKPQSKRAPIFGRVTEHCVDGPALAPPSALTFAEFRAANVARCLKWHPKGLKSWSPSDWLTAVYGELGELASLIKMRNRERDGLPGNKFSPTEKHIADEVADVFTYLDLYDASCDGEPLPISFQEGAEDVARESPRPETSESEALVQLARRISYLWLDDEEGRKAYWNGAVGALFELAAVLKVDVAAAVVSKFNEVSERVGFPDRIVCETAAAPKVYGPGSLTHDEAIAAVIDASKVAYAAGVQNANIDRLPPSKALILQALEAYAAARADTEARAADLKRAVEAERLAQVQLDEATGAKKASDAELTNSRERLIKTLNEQAPGQLVEHAGRQYVATGAVLREFDGAVSL